MFPGRWSPPRVTTHRCHDTGDGSAPVMDDLLGMVRGVSWRSDDVVTGTFVGFGRDIAEEGEGLADPAGGAKDGHQWRWHRRRHMYRNRR